MKKFQKLEAIRGLTAIYVLIHHIYFTIDGARLKLLVLGIDFSQIFKYGRLAVLVFFVLSGIVIQYSFHNSGDKSFKTYLFKRATRIYIPLLAILLITPLIQYFQSGYIVGYGIATTIGNMLMLQDLGGYRTGSIPPLFDNGALWSLSYEWWYYMFFFFISTKLCKLKINKLVYPIMLCSILLCNFIQFIPIRWGCYFIFWWIGREIAILHLNKKAINFKNLKTPLLFILLGATLLQATLVLKFYLQGWDIDFTHISLDAYAHITMLALILLGIFWKQHGWKLFDQTIGVFAKIAPISYGIYITHMPLVTQAKYLNFIDNWYLRYTLYIAICFAFSYFIERILYVKLTSYLKKKLL